MSKVMVSIYENTHEYQVWVDMDGVLADFDGAIKRSGEASKAKEDMHDLISNKFKDYIGLNDEEIKLKIKKEILISPDSELKELKRKFNIYNGLVFKVAGRAGFFASLDMLPGAIEILDAAKSITGRLPNILTAPIGDENNPDNFSVNEKKQWCLKNLSGKYNIIEVTGDKGRVVKSKMDILIDDRHKYIENFVSAGGTGILHKTPTSTDADSWKESISKLKEICQIKESIKYIIPFEKFREKKIR